MISLCTVSFSAIAQSKQLIFDHYTTDDGLSDNSCNKIVQDEDGFIWIATNSGLNRFDGKDFIKFYSTGSDKNLPGNYINDIVCLHGHRLAVATDNGLGILDTKTGICKHLHISADAALQTTTNTIWNLSTNKKGDLIAGTKAGLYVFDTAFQLLFRYDAYTRGDIGKKILQFIPVSYLMPDGNVLVQGAGFFFLLNGQKKNFQNIQYVPGNQFDLLKRWNGKSGIISDANQYGQFFFINFEQLIDSIFVVDLQNHKLSASPLGFSVSRAHQISWQSHIFLLNDSLLCISTASHDGYYLMQYDRKTLKAHLLNNSLPGTFCKTFISDKNNRLWVGTEEGIFKQSFIKKAFNDKFTPVNIPNGKRNNAVVGFLHFQHKYFILEWNTGLLIYDDSLHFIRNISFLKAGKSNLPWNITYYTKDTLLITTQYGALLLNTVNYTLKKFMRPGFPSAFDSSAITCSLIDSHHQLWLGIGQGNGVFMMNMITHSWKYFSPKIPNAVFKLRYPFSIAEDRNGNIWMGGVEGITRWNQQKQSFDTLITQLPGTSNISGDLNDLKIDTANNLWIMEKDFVLIKWNLTTSKFTSFPRAPNIRPAKTGYLNGPWQNRLWTDTDEGLLCFNIKTEQYSLIKKSDGLFDNNIEAVYFDTATQRLFTGFINAFTWLYPDDVMKVHRPVQPIITDIRKIGDSVSLTTDSALSFSYKENSFTFSFTAINYDDGGSNTYAYRLFEKNPSGFINVGNQKTVTFASLKPGNYTFQVEAILSDGTTSIRPASFNFSIAYPYYNTWWFYTLCTLLFAIALYALYRYRINQLLQMQNVRNNISADLHDDIGARLTNINLLSALGEQKVNEPEQASDYLKRIATEVQSSGEALDDIVWSINTRNDSMEEITARMRRYASEVFDGTSVQYFMQVDAPVLAGKLSMEKRKDLFLLYKEAVNNIYKHASATKVKINMAAVNNSIVMEIIDDGKGFDLQQPTHRNGLKNMQYRMQKHGGIVVINSAPGKGTSVQIKLPHGTSLKRSIWAWIKIK
ncbi:MAG: two-component regulator propeller domain-containing protein [Parafilimonas sp.]